MSKDSLKRLEHLAILVKEYNDKLELINNNKIYKNGYYKNIYEANGIRRESPKIAFSIIFLALVIYFPALIFLFEDKGAQNFGIFIVYTVVLLVVVVSVLYHYIKTLTKWNSITSQLNELKIDYTLRIEELESKIEEYADVLPSNLIYQADKIYEFMKGSNITNIKKAVELMYGQSKNTTIDITNNIVNKDMKEKYIVELCKYCGAKNISPSTHCSNCGALL